MTDKLNRSLVYNALRSINQFKAICEEEGVMLPGEGAVYGG